MITPSNFGRYSILAAVTVVVGTVAGMRYELAVPLPEREEHAYSVVYIGAAFAVLTAVVGSAALALWGNDIAAAFGEPGLMPWLCLVPMISSLMTAYLLANQLAIRHERYVAAGQRSLIQSSVTVAAQLGLSAMGGGTGGLFVGYGLGQLSGTATLVRGAGFGGKDARRGRKAECLREVAARYRRFPLFLAPAGLVNILGIQAPVLMIAYWYGSSVAGHLGMTQRVLAVPLGLVGAAVGQVYLGHLAKAKRREQEGLSRLFAQSSKALAVVGVSTVAVLVALGPWLFDTVLGSEWAVSGTYAQAMSFAIGAQLVAAPLSQTLIVLERQGVQLLWDVGRLSATVGAVWGAYLLGASALEAIWIYGSVSTVLYLIAWYLSWRAVGWREDQFSSAI